MNLQDHPIGKTISKHFFDFFMLFLAVTLGFITDNYREQRDSAKLAKELGIDLIQDISQDSISIDVMLMHCKQKKLRLDSLYLDLESYSRSDSSIYRYTAYATKRPWFERNRSTFDLLVNAGYMNVLTKKSSKAITNYENECVKLLYYLDQENQRIQNKIYPFIQQKFHTVVFDQILNLKPLLQNPVLHNWDNESRHLMKNYTIELIDLNYRIMAHYSQMKEKAHYTLDILKTEYK